MLAGGDVFIVVLADAKEWGWGRRSLKWTGKVRARAAPEH